MKCDRQPSHQDLKFLYSAAIEFRNAAPWDWMRDSDLFGVHDPVSGETGYCCVMGAAGEHYALGVYLGGEGLAGILRILSGEFYPHHEETLFVQKCLMASFEDRTYLTSEEARFLTLALQQTIEVSKRFENGKNKRKR